MSIAAASEKLPGCLGSLCGTHAATSKPDSSADNGGKRHASAVAGAASIGSGGSIEPHRSHEPART